MSRWTVRRIGAGLWVGDEYRPGVVFGRRVIAGTWAEVMRRVDVHLAEWVDELLDELA